MQAHSLGPMTAVTVNVTGTFTLPMHLEALHSLEDPMLEGEIMREAVRLALSEKLGGVDKMKVTSTHKFGNPVCEVQLDLTELCCAMANVQHTYKHVHSHLLQLRDLVSNTSKRYEDEVKNEDDESTFSHGLAAVGDLLQRALESPGEAPIVAAMRAEVQATKNVETSASSYDNNNIHDVVGPPDYRRDPWADGYKPLLDSHDTESEDMEVHEREHQMISEE